MSGNPIRAVGILGAGSVGTALARQAAGTGDLALWLAVVVPDVVVDGANQVVHVAEGSRPDALAGDLCEPALDLVQPGRTGGREVQTIPRPRRLQ